MGIFDTGNFLIVGGLYSVTALRKNNDEGVKVYTKHQDLTQTSEHHKQMTISYSPLRLSVETDIGTRSRGVCILRWNFGLYDETATLRRMTILMKTPVSLKLRPFSLALPTRKGPLTGFAATKRELFKP